MHVGLRIISVPLLGDYLSKVIIESSGKEQLTSSDGRGGLPLLAKEDWYSFQRWEGIYPNIPVKILRVQVFINSVTLIIQ